MYNKVPVFVEASAKGVTGVDIEVNIRSNDNGYHGSLNPFYGIESQVYRKATRVKDIKKSFRLVTIQQNQIRYDVAH